MLRPQSGSEHELTDPLMSLCCLAPVLRCMFCAETKHVLLSAQRCCFPICPGCAGSFAGQCRQIFSLVFSVGSLTGFCDSCNIVDVFEGSHIRQCSCCSFVTQWSGTRPLLVKAVVHEG